MSKGKTLFDILEAELEESSLRDVADRYGVSHPTCLHALTGRNRISYLLAAALELLGNDACDWAETVRESRRRCAEYQARRLSNAS